MQPLNKPNSLKRVAMATMIGTAIEYFDNYIYTMAAVLIPENCPFTVCIHAPLNSRLLWSEAALS